MSDDIELLTRWMDLPETNRTCFEALMHQCMSDAETAAVTKALNHVWSETDGNELR